MPIGLGILAVMIFIPSPQLGLRSAERAYMSTQRDHPGAVFLYAGVSHRIFTRAR